MGNWSKGIVDWIENDTAFVSVPFTWDLPKAYQRCVMLGWTHKVRAGGPAVSLMPNYLSSVAEIGGEADALIRHNPNAMFTSRGCIRKCKFCAVPKIEGDLVELEGWEPKPIVCDNNLLACSKTHFDKVIDSLKGVESVDFNQGLDVRLLTDYHAHRLAELKLSMIRFAWDHIKVENQVMSAIEKVTKVGIPKGKIRVYVLIGFNGTPEDARYRFEILKNLGVWSSPQRFNPLDTLVRDFHVGPNWTDRQLKRYMRYWSRQAWLGGISFDDYIHDETDKKENLK